MFRAVMLLVYGAATVGQAAPASAPPANDSRPNFVIFLADDLGYGDLGCYGHPSIRSPNIDQLARDGVRFASYYAPAPVCSPSRAGMLTGRTPHRLGIFDWIPKGSPMHLRREEVTIATLLKRTGYATCMVGKWHCNGLFNSPEQPQPGDHGFDHWFATQNNAGPSHENPKNFVRNGEPVGALEGYSSDLIVDEAIRWLNNRDRSKPFFLFACFHATHEPIATAQKFAAQYPNARPPERAMYYGNVTQMDEAVGRLLVTLDKGDLRDRTLVFFTSDNGPETLRRYVSATHSYGSPGPLRDMKLHMYDGGIRVPGIIRWPGHARPGTTCDEPVIGLDVLPTICEVAGIPIPTGRAIDGTSILPVFDGRGVTRTTPLFWWYRQALSRPKLAMRDGDWKILADDKLQQVELYNVSKDIGEATDLAAAEPQRLKQMLARLRERSKEVDAEAPTWPASAPAGKGR